MKTRGSLPKSVHIDSKSRRMFLKSAGGYTLAIPFMGSLMAAQKALAANSKPLRYLSLFTPIGGLQHKSWLGPNLPQNQFMLYPGHTARSATIESLLTGEGLSPVLNLDYQNLWRSMNLVAGVDQPFYFGHNRGIGLGVFARSNEGHPNPYDQVTLSGSGLITNEYPSVDQVLAFSGGSGIYKEGLGARRRQLNVTSGWSSAWGSDEYGSSTPVIARDAIPTTAGAFNYLFGSVNSGATPNLLLNLVNEFWPSGKSLMKYLSSDDRATLDHLFQLAQEAANNYSMPGLNIGNVTAPPGTTANDWNIDGSSLRAMADIVMMAFKSDVTRVANFYFDRAVDGLDWHGLSHMASNATPDAGQEELIRIHRNISQNFYARLGNNLKSTQDPFDTGSSLLDNSLLMWTHEHKCAHHNYSNPTLFMGNAGGRVLSGNVVDLRNYNRPRELDANNDQVYVGDIMNRAWSTILYAMNIPRNEYEVSRGGNNSLGRPLSKGFGHVLKSNAGWYTVPDYELGSIGEPWDFMRRPGATWG